MAKFFQIFLLLVLLAVAPLKAQEIMATVQVDESQVQSTEQRVFRDMETAFTRFFNERKWTNDEFDFNEKIRVNIQIVLKPTTKVGSYTGSMIIQAARPVYNSGYNTNTFFFRDSDLAFEYVESQPLDFNENSFNSNLTSILGFYANIILGMDYDSFEKLGGTPYFQKAENISQVARQSNQPGWNPADGGSAGRNRAALISSIMNNQLLPLRNIMYDYHRLGLDTFLEDPDKSRERVLAGLETLKEVRSYNPSSILLISFFDAKNDELTNMFTKGDIAVRRKAFELLSNMDPGKAEQYRKIIN